MADEQQLRVAELRQALRQVVEILLRCLAQLVRVEVEKQTALERHHEPFADTRDLSAGDSLLNLLRLLIHLVSDDRACRAADRGADDRAARRRASGMADDATDDRAAGGADHGSFLLLIQRLTAGRREQDRRSDGDTGLTNEVIHVCSGMAVQSRIGCKILA